MRALCAAPSIWLNKLQSIVLDFNIFSKKDFYISIKKIRFCHEEDMYTWYAEVAAPKVKFFGNPVRLKVRELSQLKGSLALHSGLHAF